MEVDGWWQAENCPASAAALREVVHEIIAAPCPIPFKRGLCGLLTSATHLFRMVKRPADRPPDPSLAPPSPSSARFDTLVVRPRAPRARGGPRDRVVELTGGCRSPTRPAVAALLDQESASAALPCRLIRRQAGGYLRRPSPRRRQLPPGGGERRRIHRRRRHLPVCAAPGWKVPRSIDPLALYRALRMVHPIPTCAVLGFPKCPLVGASPELLVRKRRSRHIETRHAGTRPKANGR